MWYEHFTNLKFNYLNNIFAAPKITISAAQALHLQPVFFLANTLNLNPDYAAQTRNPKPSTLVLVSHPLNPKPWFRRPRLKPSPWLVSAARFNLNLASAVQTLNPTPWFGTASLFSQNCGPATYATNSQPWFCSTSVFNINT